MFVKDNPKVVVDISPRLLRLDGKPRSVIHEEIKRDLGKDAGLFDYIKEFVGRGNIGGGSRIVDRSASDGDNAKVIQQLQHVIDDPGDWVITPPRLPE